MTNQPTKPKRPFGLKIVILFQFLSILVMGVEVWYLTNYQKAFWSANTPTQTEVVLIIAIAHIMISLVTIIGLWRLQSWAWFLIMIQVGITLFLNLIAYTQGLANNPSMVISVIIVFYLNQREVQQLFRRSSTDTVEPVETSA